MGQYDLKRVVLETSLKPFMRIDDDYVSSVCREILRQWLPISGQAEECAILLWVADGSEILTWKGDLSEEIEWARYIGFCNAEARAYTGHTTDPRRRAQVYIEDPPVITYADLKRIIAAFRQVGEKEFGQKIVVGATFDPGPEFAESAFKFKLHPEIMGHGEDVGIGPTVAMVRAWSELQADPTPYAGYPEGIPEGTSFGEFFGKQCQSFLATLGYDYIWLSNGFGFSHFGWSPFGENFDGQAFGKADFDEVAAKILGFWEDFHRECHFPVEVRGTNFTAGIDLASDCVPALRIYEGGYLRAPAPNYPSGALNYDFGLEMAGYLSRIAVLPEEDFPFRYYPNDPWFWQNPWWDLYGREPFDIYIPLTTGRMDSTGQVQTPRIVEFLTIDTEKGELIEECPLEVIPHVRRALKDRPDAPGILTWLYPFREYHAIPEQRPDLIGAPYFGDWFIRSAINAGLPLNTVVSTDDFQEDPVRSELRESILVAPASTTGLGGGEELIRFIKEGGRVLLYGSLEPAAPEIRQLLGLKLESGLEGELSFRTTLVDDIYQHAPGERRLVHRSLLSEGPVCEVLADTADTEVLAEVSGDAGRRVYAAYRSDQSWNGGQVAWVRGSSSFDVIRRGDRPILAEYDRHRFWDPSLLMRLILGKFGYDLRQECLDPASKKALFFAARHDNGLFFSGFKADTTVQLRLSTPEGAPVLVQKEAVLENGSALYQLEKSFHSECRVFVRQKEGLISCREMPPFPMGQRRKLHVVGLRGAQVVVCPPLDRLEHFTALVDRREVSYELERERGRILIKDVTGTLDVGW